MHLYIHIPFCQHVCPYCAFYKQVLGATGLRDYVDALIAEAQLRLPLGAKVESIFMGGGTPSIISPAHFRRLREGLGQQLDFSQLREWTIEANPASFNPAKVATWRDCGVTRVSVGVQSFEPRLLQLLGRIHSVEKSLQSIQLLQDAGIAHINLDLMFSLPSQSTAEWEHSLHMAIETGVDHISTYNLTFEEGTPFYEQYRESESNEERDLAMFQRAHQLLGAAGFEHYEVSNYAQEGGRCLHNLSCWQGGSYYALGPGGCATLGLNRYENKADTAAYMAALREGRLPPAHTEELSVEQRRAECLALALRTDTGAAPQLLRPEDAPLRQQLIGEGLALANAPNGHFVLSAQGLLLVDEIALQMLS